MPINPSRLTRSGAATTARESHVGLVGAVLLHVAVVAATFFSWTHTLDIASNDAPIVPVELVTIADVNNIAAQSPEPPKAEPQESAPPQQAAPPPIPEKVEVAPEAPKAPKVVEKKPTPPEPKTTKPKEEKFDLNSIASMLDKKVTDAAKDAKKSDVTLKGVGAQTAMTIDVETAIKSQMDRCYNKGPLLSAPNIRDTVVEFAVYLNVDGSVAQKPQLVASSHAGNLYERAGIEAAERAISTCAPFKLPANKYNQWKEFTFHFDPTE